MIQTSGRRPLSERELADLKTCPTCSRRYSIGKIRWHLMGALIFVALGLMYAEFYFGPLQHGGSFWLGVIILIIFASPPNAIEYF